ncbi:unnamed protein product [Darwinula stevensoni]|uniref:C-type lectin domain-containing protein n=1 Tax=Darwinula stevensoni TaxID=69355 RepID=A0A7R8XEJ7_9CRUS|nr:unnamed protein product [Darwinula stevensoni]CAG0887905.1 unnamed protein product [Darwinula stevensoni]
MAKTASEDDEAPLLHLDLLLLDGDGGYQFGKLLRPYGLQDEDFVPNSETTCYSFSITKSAGLATCRLGGAYDPTRISDPDSEFFFKDVPPDTYFTDIFQSLYFHSIMALKMTYDSPEGYNLVPGTKSYVKIVLDTTKTSAEAKTECEKDGAGLAIPNQEPVHNYLNETMMENAAKLTTTHYNFWVDGKAFPPNHFVWFFRDGTNVTITAIGQGHFHRIEPDYGDGCLAVAYKYLWAAPYSYGNWVEAGSCTGPRSGYFCEIRVPDVIPR